MGVSDKWGWKLLKGCHPWSVTWHSFFSFGGGGPPILLSLLSNASLKDAFSQDFGGLGSDSFYFLLLVFLVGWLSEKGGWKKGGGTSWRFWWFWRFAVNCFFESLGSGLIILDCFGGCEEFSNDKFPHSNSDPPKHDCHWFTFISLMNLAFSTKLCSQEG